MAFFKFRWPGQGEQQQAEKPSKRSRTPQAESIEVMRRRARHRLIGAAVLVLVGVIGFPLLFDTQPRPIPVDIPIEIPDRNKVAPLVVPAPVADAPAVKPAAPATPEPAPTAAAQRPAPSRTAAANGLADGEELVPSARPAPAKPTPAPAAAPAAAKPEVKHEAKPPAAPAPSPAPEPKPARADDSARARALLEGRSTEAPAAAGSEEARFIVQVGAFADAEKAREARTKVERAGLKTYTQVVDTKDGKRTRVRVGPFTNRAEADKAAARIKALDLSASVLTL
ncbi:MAG: sporulation protein [Acidovorax sp. SCN 65-28]|uniref:SPOR domain-containing protein n=1 Tax=Acidovorax sp. TaxID=1872122 RepID=UPI000868F254|nr:SPOR domain-containing protein [Acidovorax sp.]MBN9625643.1 SPOR domain-containing protein [Acidovorax sp.]ODS77296.1 MAG: sporulation protein [Acidovorax sp. SCN 65-28]